MSMNLFRWFPTSLVCVISMLALTGRAGTLTATFNSIPAGSVVNLTTNGVLDWVHWGLFTETSLDRKAGVTPQISDFTPVDASNGYVYIYQYADNANGYTWSDGGPHMAVTNTTTGVWAYGTPNIGSGFRLNVPARTNMQTLRVYVGAYAARGRFVATLSDNSANGYTNSANASVNNLVNGPSAFYTLNFAANSTNQTLDIIYTLQTAYRADGNVTLQSAALTAPGANNLPFVTITSPPEGTSVVAPTNITLTANASDSDGSVTLVEFYAGVTKLGDSVGPAYSLVWTNPPPGRHIITARAIDTLAGAGVSAPVTLFVAGSGGSLAGSRTAAPTALNLTTEGTSDWAHRGLLNASNFNHKATGGTQITDFSRLGTNAVIRFTDNRTAFSWSDGTPVSSVNNSNLGVYITGLTNGFEFRVPADTNSRTLRIYAGLYGAQGNFQAWLSDFSGRAFTDLTLSNVFGNSYVIYTLNYAAASAGQRLHIRWTIQNLFDVDYGNVTLAAATLQGPPPLGLPVQLYNPGQAANTFTFSFQSQPSYSYAAQFTPSLSPLAWQTFTNVVGNGGTLSVTDIVNSATQRFYRVLTQ